MTPTKIKKAKAPPSVHPFDRVAEWSVVPRISVLCVNTLPRDFKSGISLDVEHDGKGNFVGIGIYDPQTNSCYYWSDWELAKQLTIPKFIAHNGVSDLKCLKDWGFKVDETFILWDTMLMAHIIDSSRRNYSLKNIAKLDLGAEWPTYDDIVGKKHEKTLLDFPVEAVAEYNGADCLYTYKLYEYQKNQLGLVEEHSYSPALKYYHDIEAKCAPIFKGMEERGILIDLEYLDELKNFLEEQKQPIETAIKNELGDINLGSPKQLLEALHAKDIYPEFKNKASTDKRALARLKENPLVSKLLMYSELDTLLSSFVYAYLERKTEIVHPFFNQVGTRTSRVSCSNPNLLQIPRRTENGKYVRAMFIPREGFVLGDADYGQIEPRVLAHLSKDRNMCHMFASGTDFHTYTSDRLTIDREKAKVLNLSVGYRATFVSVSQQLKCSEQEAQTEIDEWWRMFPELRTWQDKLIWQSKKDGFFTTLMGRRIKVDGLNEYNKWKREAAQRQLINNIAQASAAEIMKMAMINVSILPATHLLVQIYDELLFEIPDNGDTCYSQLGVIIKTMENSVKLDVPLVVEGGLGYNWNECKKVKSV